MQWWTHLKLISSTSTTGPHALQKKMQKKPMPLMLKKTNHYL